jgi:hypothetical protein
MTYRRLAAYRLSAGSAELAAAGASAVARSDGEIGAAVIGERSRRSREQAASPGCRQPLGRHQWTVIEEIGLVCTYRCECGKTKTRVRPPGTR